MKARYRSVGPWGLTLLVVASVVGVLLASHGWTHRGTNGGVGSLGGQSGAAHTTPATSSTSAPPRAGPTANSGGGAPGPLLTSQPFAQYSFVIWPGTPSVSAKAALAGLSVNVHQQASGLSVTAAVNGQQAGSPHFYPKGVRVYVVEASMGDDSGNSDYNLGDDGIVVTDAQGRIVS